ncbi:hypothetical protein RF11_09415 [Thelohanellus kitauei]|uniref:Uncharacterized protein n=1 Tax=Thelohanellus kitauei TaxID=669202 RepID=A0A0C2N252_THEKT|nr:hypothetical protein RF11_09415 [Thelohanellus kitauei]
MKECQPGTAAVVSRSCGCFFALEEFDTRAMSLHHSPTRIVQTIQLACSAVVTLLLGMQSLRDLDRLCILCVSNNFFNQFSFRETVPDLRPAHRHAVSLISWWQIGCHVRWETDKQGYSSRLRISYMSMIIEHCAQMQTFHDSCL